MSQRCSPSNRPHGGPYSTEAGPRVHSEEGYQAGIAAHSRVHQVAPQDVDEIVYVGTTDADRERGVNGERVLPLSVIMSEGEGSAGRRICTQQWRDQHGQRQRYVVPRQCVTSTEHLQGRFYRLAHHLEKLTMDTRQRFESTMLTTTRATGDHLIDIVWW